MSNTEPYWYLASYPKSGNTWCRVFITELRRLAGLASAAATAAAEESKRELRLNRDLATGTIVSSRRWLDDQLRIDSSDLQLAELDNGAAVWVTSVRCITDVCAITRCMMLL